MEVRLKYTLRRVKMHMTDTAVRADRRRLAMYRGKIRCRSGCSGCCSRMIRITMAEAVLIYEHLKGSGAWPEVRKACMGQLKLLGSAGAMTWFKMNQKCPVLNKDTNMCKAYKVRPPACSTHFVTSDPELCDPWSANQGKYESVDSSDLTEEFQKRLEESIRGEGILMITLPMASALTLAEKISVKSGLNLPEIVTLFFKELQ